MINLIRNLPFNEWKISRECHKKTGYEVVLREIWLLLFRSHDMKSPFIDVLLNNDIKYYLMTKMKKTSFRQLKMCFIAKLFEDLSSFFDQHLSDLRWGNGINQKTDKSNKLGAKFFASFRKKPQILLPISFSFNLF